MQACNGGACESSSCRREWGSRVLTVDIARSHTGTAERTCNTPLRATRIGSYASANLMSARSSRAAALRSRLAHMRVRRRIAMPRAGAAVASRDGPGGLTTADRRPRGSDTPMRGPEAPLAAPTPLVATVLWDLLEPCRRQAASLAQTPAALTAAGSFELTAPPPMTPQHRARAAGAATPAVHADGASRAQASARRSVGAVAM